MSGIHCYSLNKSIHPGRIGRLHPLRDVAVDIKGKSLSVMTQVLLYRHDVIPALEGGDSVAVPLSHNGLNGLSLFFFRCPPKKRGHGE